MCNPGSGPNWRRAKSSKNCAKPPLKSARARARNPRSDRQIGVQIPPDRERGFYRSVEVIVDQLAQQLMDRDIMLFGVGIDFLARGDIDALDLAEIAGAYGAAAIADMRHVDID